MKSNFEFLDKEFPVLSQFGKKSRSISLFRFKLLPDEVRNDRRNSCELDVYL